jgi:hypothetical protein
MKKNRDSSELSARLAAAASQPAGPKSAPVAAVPVPAPVLVSSTPEAKVSVAAPTRSKLKKAKPEQDTVPITLRPSRALLSKFVLNASERTREEGRVISAQQIMLEALERSIL